jgi:hypothetical protein
MAAEWHLWREALLETFTCGGNSKFTGRNERGQRKLRHSLGRWLVTEQRQWWFDKDSGNLYNSEGTGTLFARKSQKRTRSQAETFHKVQENVSIPTRAVPATIAGEGRIVRLEGVSQAQESPSRCSIERVWDSDIRSTDSWVLEGTTISKSQGQSVANAVRTGKTFGVTDGSFKDGWGMASAIIVGDSDDHIRLDVVVPGRPEDQCPFRSEAAGIYAVCRVVQAICEEAGVETGSMVVACDGLSPIKRCQIKDDRACVQDNHFDLVSGIREMMDCKKIEWQLRHVKGHQTEITDIWGELNDKMDAACKLHWQRTVGIVALRKETVAREPWTVWISGRKVCSKLATTVRKWIQDRRAMRYWSEKYGRAAEEVDWTSVSNHRKSMDVFRQRWLTKHSSNICGVGKMMKAMRLADSAKCPRCRAEEETAEHVWICLCEEAQEVWTKGLSAIRGVVEPSGSEKSIQAVDAMAQGLTAWREGSEVEMKQEWSEVTIAVVERQRRVGWRSLVEGRPALGWIEVFDEGCVPDRHNRLLGKRWLLEILKKLIGIAWDLWTQRNGALHKSDQSQIEQEINKAVRVLGQQASRIAGLEEYVKVPEGTRAQWPLSVKRNWITVVVAAMYRMDIQPECTAKWSKWLRRKRGNTGFSF